MFFSLMCAPAQWSLDYGYLFSISVEHVLIFELPSFCWCTLGKGVIWEANECL